MSLRDLKRSGGYLLPDARGAWIHYHAGEQPKCPYADCRRAFAGPIYPGRTASVRIPSAEPDESLLWPMVCRNCRREFQVAVPQGRI